jgi:peroxiredoxin
MTDLRHEALLPAGTPAPQFDLQSGPDQTLGLGDLRGRPAVLAFYPADVRAPRSAALAEG